MAIKKANECNMAALANGRKTFGRNTAMLITLARFNEGMAELNSNLEGPAANANFIYIKFSVSKRTVNILKFMKLTKILLASSIDWRWSEWNLVPDL